MDAWAVGKILPTILTPRGRRSLEQATAAVRSVEVRMLSGLSDADQAAALRILRSMVSSLRADPDVDGDPDGDAGSAAVDGGGEPARDG